MVDAVLIEIYASQVARAMAGDVYAFVTSNHRDFSVPSAAPCAQADAEHSCL